MYIELNSFYCSCFRTSFIMNIFFNIRWLFYNVFFLIFSEIQIYISKITWKAFWGNISIGIVNKFRYCKNIVNNYFFIFKNVSHNQYKNVHLIKIILSPMFLYFTFWIAYYYYFCGFLSKIQKKISKIILGCIFRKCKHKNRLKF